MTGWQDSFQPAAAPAANGGWQSSFQPSQQPQAPVDNRFMAQEPGYDYGQVLPFRVKTGESGAPALMNMLGALVAPEILGMSNVRDSVAVPEMLRSPIRGMQDLETMSQNKSVDMTPDAVNAASMMLPFEGGIPTETNAVNAIKSTPTNLPDNNASGFLASDASGKQIQPPIPTSQELRDVASPMFNVADTQHAISPELANSFAEKAASLTPQTEGGKIVFGKPSAAEEVATNIQGLRDRPLTLQETQEIDSRLGQLAEDNFDKVKGDYNSEGVKYLQLQRHLRDVWENASEKDVLGGKEAYNKIMEARDLWAAQARMADIERLQKRAEMSGNPQTVIKNGAARILMNPKGYNADEIAALKSASKTGVLGTILKGASSKAIDAIVGGLAGFAGGGPVGSAVGSSVGAGVGAAAKGAGNKLQAAKLTNVKRTIAQRPVVQRAIKP